MPYYFIPLYFFVVNLYYKNKNKEVVWVREQLTQYTIIIIYWCSRTRPTSLCNFSIEVYENNSLDQIPFIIILLYWYSCKNFVASRRFGTPVASVASVAPKTLPSKPPWHQLKIHGFTFDPDVPW